MFANLDRELKAWHVIVPLIVAVALYYYLISVGAPKLDSYTGGLDIFDLRMVGYTENDAVTLLAALGTEGRSYYRGTMVIDIFFPPAWFLTTMFAVLWFSRPGRAFAVPLLDSLRLIIIVVAGFALLLDWLENVLVFLMLESDGVPPTTLVELASTVTYMKWIAYLVSFVGLALTFIMAFLHWAAFSPARA